MQKSLKSASNWNIIQYYSHSALDFPPNNFNFALCWNNAIGPESSLPLSINSKIRCCSFFEPKFAIRNLFNEPFRVWALLMMAWLLFVACCSVLGANTSCYNNILLTLVAAVVVIRAVGMHLRAICRRWWLAARSPKWRKTFALWHQGHQDPTNATSYKFQAFSNTKRFLTCLLVARYGVRFAAPRRVS